MGTHRYQGAVLDKLPFELQTTEVLAAVITLGDFLEWDASAKNVIQATQATGTNFVGIAEDEGTVFSLGRTITKFTVRARGMFKFKTTSGDTYVFGDVVYMGADAQTVKKTAAGTFKVGVVFLPPEQQVAGVAGGAGIEVSVALTPNYPDITIY